MRNVGPMLLASMMMSGCATITRGTSQAFTVESEPPGAQVALSTGQTCAATPCVFAKVKREAEFSVTVSKPGFKSSTHEVTHQAAGAGAAGMAGNVLLGGLIGAAIDANSGATQQLTPNPLRVTLDAEAAPALAAAAPVAAPEAPAAEKPPEIKG